MPGTVTRTPAKRALADATNNRANVLASPRSAKKLKVDNGTHRTGPPVKTANGSFNSSQPAPSQFEETLEKMTQDMETLRENNTERDQQWRRPALSADFNEVTQKLVFQQIEAEEGVLNGGRPTVKLFGVTENGHSVLLHVTGFMHYFYVAAPVGFQPHDCDAYKNYLESESQKQHNQHSAVIYSVQMTMRENILRYQGNQKSPYLKITVNDPKAINRVRTMVQKGFANWKQLWPVQEGGILTFDNIAYVLRFMIDTKVRLPVPFLVAVADSAGLRHVLGRGSCWQIPRAQPARPTLKLPD
jgi:DNA polymerase delta subunit 1